MSDKPKTAVQWLKMKVAYNRILTPEDIEKALAMEREQHHRTWVDSAIVITHENDPETFEEYFKDVYGE